MRRARGVADCAVSARKNRSGRVAPPPVFSTALQRSAGLALVLLLAPLLSIAVEVRADSEIRIASELPRARHTLHGRLSVHEDLPVLELWGSPEQAAYAHGFLLAESIIRLFDEFVLDPKILPNPALYESVLVPGVRRQFVWTAEQVSELEALIRGMEDRLPAESLVSRVLDRPLRIEDLMIGNTLADWFGVNCTTFSVWGDLTPDGKTLTARNLDFPSTPVMARMQIVVVRRADGNQPGWIGIGWPGTVGIYTAMNEHGVTMLMHDAGGLPPSAGVGFTPRALVLREALLAARETTWFADVQEVFRQRLVLVGNNIHVSGPHSDGMPPAVVFEYDANARDRGVTARVADGNDSGRASALWCTNHMRMRKAPAACGRYQRLERDFARAVQQGERITLDQAFAMLDAVRQDITLHGACFVPESRTVRVRIPAVSPVVSEFRLSDWLKRSENDSVHSEAATPGVSRP